MRLIDSPIRPSAELKVRTGNWAPATRSTVAKRLDPEISRVAKMKIFLEIFVNTNDGGSSYLIDAVKYCMTSMFFKRSVTLPQEKKIPPEINFGGICI